MTAKECNVQDCDRQTRTQSADLCEKHYSRWKRHGDPLVVLKDHTPPEQRWRYTYRVDDRGCWVWTGPLSRGYGVVSCGAGNQRSAHIFVWEQHNGPVPDGLELDHKCRNPACVRPAHLEAVTHLVNVRRGDAGINNARKTHCTQGHEFTTANTSHTKQGFRQCRACARRSNREAQRRYRERKREAGR